MRCIKRRAVHEASCCVVVQQQRLSHRSGICHRDVLCTEWRTVSETSCCWQATVAAHVPPGPQHAMFCTETPTVTDASLCCRAAAVVARVRHTAATLLCCTEPRLWSKSRRRPTLRARSRRRGRSLTFGLNLLNTKELLSLTRSYQDGPEGAPLQLSATAFCRCFTDLHRRTTGER